MENRATVVSGTLAPTRHGSLLVALTLGCGSGHSEASAGSAVGSSSGDSAAAGLTPPSSGEQSAGSLSASQCLAASALGILGKRDFMIGVSSTDALAASAPFDIRYEYISGGISDGTGPCASCASGCTSAGHACSNAAGGCAWWGCYQYDQDPPGAYVRGFDATTASATPPQIPMFTYYEILQVATAAFSGFQEGKSEITQAAVSATLMSRYYADWRFLLQQIGPSVAVLHIEPDFWGYAQQTAADPTMLPASVSANADCAALPDTIAGMGKCMISMVRKYAPHALVGLHASAWASGPDVSLNTDPTLDVAAEAKKVATFLVAAGEADADLVIVETSDRDAGYYASIGRNTAWDATNATLPDFHQNFAWVTALTEALGKPALYWQTPLGNENQDNTTNHWKDNRVDYFFAHPDELAAAHAIGAAFGAGAGDQTLPTTDGGNFVAKTKAYSQGGELPLCQ
jgi:hypothetical protein